jgi:predicted MFS family arabinose efflux permease
VFFAPFQVRSFRFQWIADLMTSWAIEMEVLILGWFILVETGSVFLLTVYGSLQYLGTLVSPMLGMAGDRFGHRNVLCAMRAWYALLAGSLAAFALLGVLSPVQALLITGACGMVRPSDIAMRTALVSQIVPANRIVSAMGVSRMTGDSARVIGAVAGAGVFTLLGIGPAYLLITALYLSGLILNLVFVPALPRLDPPAHRPGFLPEVWEGMRYVWRTPVLLAAMALAFLVNLTAYPTTLGLLPYVAREIYHIDQNGLGLLLASFSLGALAGSMAVGFLANHLRPARAMILAAFGWYLLVLAFVYMPDATSGRITLVLAGFCQSFSMVPLSAMLMRVSENQYRGRVMGVRMLAIYGLPVGLMVYSPIMNHLGFVATASAYCLLGLFATAGIAWYWRAAIWPEQAIGNRQ